MKKSDIIAGLVACRNILSEPDDLGIHNRIRKDFAAHCRYLAEWEIAAYDRKRGKKKGAK
jgi:hypothetical protein